MHRNLLGTILLMLFAFGLSACEKNVESSSKEAVDQVGMMPVPVQAPSSDSDDAQDESVDHANLFDTYWKLLELQGEPVITPEDMREAHLILASSESRAHGFSGCNNFFGAYTSDGDSLSFSAMGATMMACVEGMETEQAFFKALGEASRATISGQFMTLYANDHPVARFEAVYL